MADQFRIVPYVVRSAGTDVPPEEVQAGINSLANQTTAALNTIATTGTPPTGAAGGDLSGTYPNPTVAAVHATTGTLAAAVTGVTGNGADNSASLSTNAFVNQQLIRFSANVPLAVTGGVYNQGVLGSGAQFVIFVSGGVVSSVVSVISGGTGYAVGDMLLVSGGNYDARVRVTNVVGGVIQSGGLQVLYGGTGYTTGATVAALDVPPGQRTIVLNGVLTSNLTYILQSGNFNNASRRPEFVNNTTGAFTVTVKISNGLGGSTGTGVVLPQGTNNSTATTLMTDGSTDAWLANTPAGIGAASLASPAFTGTPTAPTAATNTNTTQLSTTAFVEGEFASPPAAGFGSTTPRPVAATTLNASGAVTGTGITNLFASPPAIGGSTPAAGAFTTLSSTGNFTPSQTNGIVGTTTNNNANAGSVGEFLSNSTTGTALTTVTNANITSISLTAGDWDVWGVAKYNAAAGCTPTSFADGASTTSVTFGVDGTFSTIAATFTTAATQRRSLQPQRFSLSGTTTVFLVAQAGFSGGTMTADGYLFARRRR